MRIIFIMLFYLVFTCFVSWGAIRSYHQGDFFDTARYITYVLFLTGIFTAAIVEKSITSLLKQKEEITK